MTELLVGTKKGLFALRGDPGSEFEIAARAFAGEPVEFATRDPRSGRYLASVTSAFYGPKIFVTDDPSGEWEQSEGPALPEGGDTALKRIWTIVPGEQDNLLYAGGDPGVLFESRDGGSTWELNIPFWEQPSRPEWSPGAGGMCLHSIATWPGDPNRLAMGISARGVWLTDDGGETWRQGIEGLLPEYVPEESREGSLDLCVHNMHRAPKQPERLFMQFHGGVYRSDDAGESWIDIGTETGLPSDFGFPLVVDPDDPDSAYVIPLVADMDRVTPEGRCACTRRATQARAGPRAATDCPLRTPTSRSCARPSAARARERAWASTSVRRRATCSGRAMQARRGSRRPRTCRPCTPYEWHSYSRPRLSTFSGSIATVTRSSPGARFG